MMFEWTKIEKKLIEYFDKKEKDMYDRERKNIET